MNQKIKELAIKADLYVDLNGNPWPKWMSAEECEVAYAKFAELLIKDCALHVRNRGSFLRYDALAKDILNHYGIE
jgi:hypothetical protein